MGTGIPGLVHSDLCIHVLPKSVATSAIFSYIMPSTIVRGGINTRLHNQGRYHVIMREAARRHKQPCNRRTASLNTLTYPKRPPKRPEKRPLETRIFRDIRTISSIAKCNDTHCNYDCPEFEHETQAQTQIRGPTALIGPPSPPLPTLLITSPDPPPSCLCDCQ